MTIDQYLILIAGISPAFDVDHGIDITLEPIIVFHTDSMVTQLFVLGEDSFISMVN